MLTRPEIHHLTHDYIGVSGGYLGDFSYRTHAEFYRYYCELDIDPTQYQGTTRERFMRILEEANTANQLKILRGVFSKYPISSFPEDQQPNKQTIYNEFQHIIARLEAENTPWVGASGEIKNLIFAANGPKPEIVLSDAMTNEIEIVENAEYCLVYDQSIAPTGLSWQDLVKWWANLRRLHYPGEEAESGLMHRLFQSLGSPPEQIVFNIYYDRLRTIVGDALPALIPQVYLHYDPRTLHELQGRRRIPRQRMDFLMLFSNSDRVVVEVDGKQHYSNGDFASPAKYAEMVAADRYLRLAGYEVYRFGGYELQGVNQENIVEDFFRRLLRKHTGFDL